jgi:hypothetical protein
MKMSIKYIIGLSVVLVIAMTLPHPAAQVKAAPCLCYTPFRPPSVFFGLQQT